MTDELELVGQCGPDELPDDLYVVNCHQCQKLLRGVKSANDNRCEKLGIELGVKTTGGVHYCMGCFTYNRDVPVRESRTSDYANLIDNGIRCYEDRFDT